MDSNCGIGAIRSVDYIIIPCDDLQAMRSFYTEVLRLEVRDEGPEWIGLKVGALNLGLRPRGRAYDGPSSPPQTAGIQLSFRVPPADVSFAYENLQDHNDVKIIEGPTSQGAAWGHRTLFFHDPENNIIEIYADEHPDNAGEDHAPIHDL